MLVSNFNYHLPKRLIAQKPSRPRDHSRLLVLNRKDRKISHYHFYEIGQFLKPGDVLVFNDTKVFPARLIGKKETGGKIEVFLLKQIKKQTWECLLGGPKRKEGATIYFKNNLEAKVIKKLNDGLWQIKFNLPDLKTEKIIHQIGQVPTPPYIKSRIKNSQLKKDYQTVYAKRFGSVAAPTAGFHFTKPLLKKLKTQGIQFEFITLEVGYGTFQPVKTKQVEKHKMHPEYVTISKETARRINQAKKEKRRVIAVGTTTTRALESLAGKNGQLKPGSKYINIFIYPPYRFKVIDGLITNFHLPQSTLLMLVSALANRNLILKAYNLAVKKKYRFYSFGDAMLVE